MLEKMSDFFEAYHYDTPFTVKHETEALLEAGFSSVEVLKNLGGDLYYKSSSINLPKQHNGFLRDCR